MGKLGKILGGIAVGAAAAAAGTAIGSAIKHHKNNDDDDDDFDEDEDEDEEDEEEYKPTKENLSYIPEIESFSCRNIIIFNVFITIFVGLFVAIFFIFNDPKKMILPIILVSIGLLLMYTASFFIGLLVYKNRTNAAQEKINELKSETRIAKARYVQRVTKTKEFTQDINESQGKALKNANNGGVNFYGAGRINNNYKESIAFTKDLFDNLNLYQGALTKAIRRYNVFIKKFPNSIYSHILKLKPEGYVANETLDKSLDIGQDEF